MSWWLLGGLGVSWFPGGFLVIFRRVLVVSWWFLNGASVVSLLSRCCLGRVLVLSRLCNGAFTDSCFLLVTFSRATL